MRSAIAAILCVLSLATSACIGPRNYHLKQSAFTLDFPASGPDQPDYFYRERVYESYIEFDERGRLYSDEQVKRATSLISALQHPAGKAEQNMFLFVFVHGWKNNASEDSGNVWGFRRMLDHQASKLHSLDPSIPVMGVYMGWPGDVAKVGKFFSFWNRESVAQAVGSGDLEAALDRLLIAEKGSDYQGESSAVLIGHSFGGLILERAAINIVERFLGHLKPGTPLEPPADLLLLLNEAAPAAQAKPFLKKLVDEKITFEDENGKPYPLMVSMTSEGDTATKLALPAGEFLSLKRPKTVQFDPVDTFRQSSSLPYELSSAANLVALQSHDVLQVTAANPCKGIRIPNVHAKDYCIDPKPNQPEEPAPLNSTPYWIMQLPQVFVPDHGSIFRDEVITLVSAFLAEEGFLPTNRVNSTPRTMGGKRQSREFTVPTAGVRPAPTEVRRRPVLRKQAR